MKFVENTPVITADGAQVGTVDKVVIDPSTKQVSHIIIEKGFFFTEDQVIDIRDVDYADASQVKLVAKKDELNLQPFEEQEYVPIEEIEEDDIGEEDSDYQNPLYAYPTLGTTHYGVNWFYHPGVIEPGMTKIERNIPDDAIALEEGADVYSSNEQHVGEIESVITNDETQRITHITIAEGLFFKDRTLIPILWVNRVEENKVYLSVHSKTLAVLPNYDAIQMT